MRRWLLIAVLLLAGCSSAPSSATPSPSGPPDSAATPVINAGGSGERLFAVLEPGGDFAQMRNDVVAIVRVNGTARARAAFKLMTSSNFLGA